MSDLEFYSGTLSNGLYESLHVGNSVFDLLYSTFNSTGFVAVGFLLFLASSKMDVDRFVF